MFAIHWYSVRPAFWACFFGIFLGSTLSFAGETYEVDPAHSSVIFSVKHLGVSFVYGRFNEFSGVISYDKQDPTRSSWEAIIKTDSVDSGAEKRDKHLRSPDFFSSKEFPEIQFKSTKVTKRGSALAVHGDLTLLGVTKPVSMELTEVGAGKDPWGGYRRGFHGTLKVKRSDFNMKFGLGEGGLGDQVQIILSLETVRK